MMDNFWDNRRWTRIVAIDPGTSNLGVSVLAYDELDPSKVYVLASKTLDGDAYERRYTESQIHNQNKRVMRNMGLSEDFYKIVAEYKPHHVCSESPFAFRVQVFLSLIEQITMLRFQLNRWGHDVPFTTVVPKHLKTYMGVKGKEKEKMHRALLKRTDVFYSDHLDPKQLDEHEVDSICVGLYFAKPS